MPKLKTLGGKEIIRIFYHFGIVKSGRGDSK